MRRAGKGAAGSLRRRGAEARGITRRLARGGSSGAESDSTFRVHPVIAVEGLGCDQAEVPLALEYARLSWTLGPAATRRPDRRIHADCTASGLGTGPKNPMQRPKLRVKKPALHDSGPPSPSTSPRLALPLCDRLKPDQRAPQRRARCRRQNLQLTHDRALLTPSRAPGASRTPPCRVALALGHQGADLVDDGFEDGRPAGSETVDVEGGDFVGKGWVGVGTRAGDEGAGEGEGVLVVGRAAEPGERVACQSQRRMDWPSPSNSSLPEYLPLCDSL